MNRKALFFGRDGEPRLFGSLMQPDDGADPDFGVVFFGAFGEERQKSYRSTFLFASQLAEQGIPSFRFDCAGIGDSEGNLKDTTVEQMCDESEYATNFALDMMGVDEVVVLGVRFGAAIAIESAARIDALRACVLWNPITNGAKYYRELMRTEMIINLARKQGNRPAEYVGANSNLTEIDAEQLTAEMIEQIKQIDLTNNEFSIPKMLLTSRADNKREMNEISRLAEHAQNRGTDVSHWNGEPKEFWTARSMHDAYYPTETFDATMSWLKNPGGASHA